MRCRTAPGRPSGIYLSYCLSDEAIQDSGQPEVSEDAVSLDAEAFDLISGKTRRFRPRTDAGAGTFPVYRPQGRS
ncbi:hypothetical protein [Leisingera methylohalidivorans]|uniref:Uncharacterized protein n=1 Tax=Leisingera methylohalidivorans DSM 14336 TaxID=999552 RepID=V9VVR9_9RHOB|nr:hypothetical protein [Leisingera methylohalidivorans]AHD02841.1 hypothetical protein METH_02480 [Leisingera methylohalidivorans DSM 14336]